MTAIEDREGDKVIRRLPKSSTNGGGNTNIKNLPDEILEEIFSFLTVKERVQTELVCKHWRIFGKIFPWGWPKVLTFKADPQNAIRNLGTANPVPASDQLLLSVLSRCGLKLRKLIVKQNLLGAWHSKDTLDIIGQNCPNLTELRLINIPMDSKVLRSLSKNCPSLKIVCVRKFGDFYEEDLGAFLKNSQSLECLRIATCINYTTGVCFDVISKKMRALALMNCSHLQPVALNYLTSWCEHIQELRLTCCVHISENDLSKVLIRYRETLRILQIDGFSHPVNWMKALSVLRNLETLSLGKCLNVTSVLVPVLVKNCPKLNSLYIERTTVNDAGLSYLVTFPNLIILDISGIPVNGICISCLALHGRLVKLRAVSCTNSICPDPDYYFGELAELSPHLRVLDVSLNVQITNRLVDTICSALTSGCLKGPVKLGVKETMVTPDVTMVDGLQVYFGSFNSFHVEEEDFQSDNGYDHETLNAFSGSYEFFSE